ncbi:MAG TPA: FtsX-like permease family protein, partial [Bryobacteraceae bacterium]|nr:FtsX-like permease family protein [Bryobacteraceae bacterium]
AQVAALDPDLPMINVRTMDRVIYESFTGLRYSASVMLVLGLLALVLAIVGIYAVLSRMVEERRHEIGIRVALGASAGQVRGGVISQSMKLVTIGSAVGLAGAVVLADTLSFFLFGVTSGDWTVYAGVTAIFILAALAASWIPAERAMRVDPIVALRNL